MRIMLLDCMKWWKFYDMDMLLLGNQCSGFL
jgi:hypothetical protein